MGTLISCEQLNEVLKLQQRAMKKHTDMRKGQAFVNALHQVSPTAHNAIVGTTFDPFYNDEYLGECISYLTRVKS